MLLLKVANIEIAGYPISYQTNQQGARSKNPGGSSSGHKIQIDYNQV
jgi:hypothetical protein